MKIDHDLHQRRGCIFVFITALARIFGLITFAGLTFLTYLEWFEVDSGNFWIYITIVTSIVAYLELLWIFDKCVTCCICCFRSETYFYWICCIPIDNWLRAIVYISLSIPFFAPAWLLFTIRPDVKIVGILLIITGILYFVKTFKYKRSHNNDKKEDDNLVDVSNSFPRSISTQTSTMAINNNNDNIPSASTTDQETNLEH